MKIHLKIDYTNRNSFKYQSKQNSTELSKCVWDLKNKETPSELKWSTVDTAPSYINGSRRCPLCIAEKYHIIFTDLDLLNKRSELVTKCRHENKFILLNYKDIPPEKH